MALAQDVNGRIWQSYVDPGDGTAAMQVILRPSATAPVGLAANLLQTGTAAAAAGVTLTLPAVVGQFHYITAVEITLFAAALLTVAATPVLITTTNLNSLVWSMSASAQAQGTVEERFQSFPAPWKSAAVNTATTIVAPATTGVIWRLNCWYFAAA